MLTITKQPHLTSDSSRHVLTSTPAEIAPLVKRREHALARPHGSSWRQMMWTLLAVVLLAGTVLAAPRDKRQAPCTNIWTPPTNPCLGSHRLIYYPHPTDASMFLQCDSLGRMYVIRCPTGTFYDRAITACQPNSGVKVTVPPPTTSTFCTTANILAGLIYFAIPGDNTKFVECGPRGTATILSCPSQLIWDQSRKSCIYDTSKGTISPVTQAPVVTPGPTYKNPCLSPAARAGKLYFPHPDIHKFIQCDVNGDAFVVTCPGGLIWNTVLETCYAPYKGTLVVG